MQTWKSRRAEVAQERDLQACDMMANLRTLRAIFTPKCPFSSIGTGFVIATSIVWHVDGATFRQAAPVDLAALCQTYSAVSETVNSYQVQIRHPLQVKALDGEARQSGFACCVAANSIVRCNCAHVVHSKCTLRMLHRRQRMDTCTDELQTQIWQVTVTAQQRGVTCMGKMTFHQFARGSSSKRKHVSNSHRDSITDAYTPLVQTSALDTTNVGGQMLHKDGEPGGSSARTARCCGAHTSAGSFS